MYSVDTGNQLDVWLVKVPKYLANTWKNAPEKAELGKLQKNPDGSLKFFLDPELDHSKSNSASTNDQLPTEHKLTLQPITHQRMVILSQTKDASASGNKTATSSVEGASALTPGSTANDKISFEGDVNFRGELRPTGDKSYMNLRTSLIRQAAKPTKVTQILDKAVTTYKPRGATQLAHEAELRRRKDEAKRIIREDKEIVLNRLYSAFEKERYYNIKDLVRITNQPLPYLKEILKDVCVYCSKSTHKNMWELKPEYRHYKS